MRINLLPVTSGSYLPGTSRIQALITGSRIERPGETLWFEVPDAWETSPQTIGSALLLAVFPLAIAWREDLEFSGPTHPLTLLNLRELGWAWNRWDPGLRVPRVKTELAKPILKERKETGAFFSGGVDSWFTLRHYSREVAPALGSPISTLLSVWGMDVALEWREGFEVVRDSTDRVGQALGLPISYVATNLRTLPPPHPDWGLYWHSCVLASVGHLASGQLSTLLLSSGKPYELLRQWGSHPATDHLLGGESLSVRHYGAGFSRFEKTEYLVSDPLCQKHLRVCWLNPMGVNCSVCEKCVRTMAMVYLLGGASDFSTFDWSLWDPARIRSFKIDSWGDLPHGWSTIRALASAKGERELASAIRAAERRFRREAALGVMKDELRALPTLRRVVRHFRRLTGTTKAQG